MTRPDNMATTADIEELKRLGYALPSYENAPHSGASERHYSPRDVANGPPGGRGAGSRVPIETPVAAHGAAHGSAGGGLAAAGPAAAACMAGRHPPPSLQALLGSAAGGGKSPCHSRRTEGPWMDSRRVYASKLQASVAGRLDQERRIGGLVSVIPEVSIPVGRDGDETVRHRIDFLAILEVRPDGSFVGRWIEAKGRDLPAGRAKRGAVRALYGTPVEVWR